MARFELKLKVFCKMPTLEEREKMDGNMHTIFKRISKYVPTVQYLPRDEPSICSRDRKKQLKNDDESWTRRSRNYKFKQTQCHLDDLFTAEELAQIGMVIKKELEEHYLSYKLDNPKISYVVSSNASLAS